MIVQVDIGSAQQMTSPKYVIVAHQTRNRKVAPNKNNFIAVFKNINLRKCYEELNGVRYPRYRVLINCKEKNILIDIEILNYFVKSMLENSY